MMHVTIEEVSDDHVRYLGKCVGVMCSKFHYPQLIHYLSAKLNYHNIFSCAPSWLAVTLAAFSLALQTENNNPLNGCELPYQFKFTWDLLINCNISLNL